MGGRLRRYIVVTGNPGITPSGRQESLEAIRGEVETLGVRIGDLRVAQDHLEFDVFAAPSMLPEALKRLEGRFGPARFLRNLEVAPPQTDRQQALIQAIRLFNCQRYWETHEVLEVVWRRAQGEERKALQAFILLAAAFVHNQKGRRGVALGILARALKLLDETKAVLPGIDMAALKGMLRESLQGASVKPFRIPLEGGYGRLESLLNVC